MATTVRRKLEIPEWAEYDTILEGVEKMQPVLDSLKNEMLAGQKAKKARKPKRVSYHMNRIVNILFNLETYFWHPMFEWAKDTDFERMFRNKQTPLQKALARAAKKKAAKNA